VEKTPAVESTRKTVMVVDDEPSVLRFVSGLLSAANYNILTDGNGAEAIRQAAEYAGTIHLLLSDFQMPGITGIELATRICEDRPEMKVLLMSGFPGGMLVLNEGWHFLAKPFIPSQLRSIVTTVLNEVPPFTAATSL
jgi:two-component system, cell cycle sensor histidine kinase and response regulator CckA